MHSVLSGAGVPFGKDRSKVRVSLSDAVQHGSARDILEGSLEVKSNKNSRVVDTDTDRHRQTQTDTDRHRQTQTDTDRHRQTQTDTMTQCQMQLYFVARLSQSECVG